jgi:hypothetical protein
MSCSTIGCAVVTLVWGVSCCTLLYYVAYSAISLITHDSQTCLPFNTTVAGRCYDTWAAAPAAVPSKSDETLLLGFWNAGDTWL